MASFERGTKRICAECSSKFYDLNRDPILCPSCGTKFVIAPERTAPVVAKKEEVKVEEKEEEKEEATVEVAETDEAAKSAGAEVISINDVEGEGDDDDDDNEVPDDVEDVEVDESIGKDGQDTFLEEDDDDDDKLGIEVPKSDNEQ